MRVLIKGLRGLAACFIFAASFAWFGAHELLDVCLVHWFRPRVFLSPAWRSSHISGLQRYTSSSPTCWIWPPTMTSSHASHTRRNRSEDQDRESYEQECRKFRICIIGKAGVGKTTLLSKVFGINEDEVS